MPTDEFYKIDNLFFLNKVEAIRYASQENKNISWHYKDDYFNNYDWLTEPLDSLDNIYKNRCLELRKNYDYLILFFSGGSDSQNILDSFLKNNILLDEIVVSFPKSGLDNFIECDTDTSPENNISEFKFTIFPVIEKIKKQYTNIKITVHDYYIDMLDYKSMDWILNSSDWIHPSTYAKFNLNRYNHIHEQLIKGTVGILYGSEKPILYKKNQSIYYLLTDVAVNGAVQSIDHPRCFVERFYLSTNIMSKQAHVLLNKIESNLLNIEELRTTDIAEYQSQFTKHIYPNLIKSGFQTKKATRRFMVESDNWFYSLHKNSDLYKMMHNDYTNFISSIDKKFLNSKGFKTFYKNFKIKN